MPVDLFGQAVVSRRSGEIRGQTHPALPQRYGHRVTSLLWLQLQNTADDPGDLLPACGFARELTPSRLGDRVETRTAVVLRRAPFRRNPAALFKAHERRIHGSLVQLQPITA